ncbi:hypothetical protein [Candidatus Methylacidithermus pantelleriae]|nr:hypothetical protein [Candidatus Methylacidithermus pantelleriae]
MRAKRSAAPCAESGKALVIERWDLGKSKPELESADPLGTRSLVSFA